MRLGVIAAACSAGTLFGQASFAQATRASYDGDWTARITAPSGDYAATLTIAGDTGAWRDMSGSTFHADPCVGLKSPVTVLEVTLEKLRIAIKPADVMAGCVNSQILFKRVDGRTMTGTRFRVQTVTLTRR